MPRPSASGDSRFNDLLQPCADINKNWAINITDILKSYLDELANINGANVNGNVSLLNFAEAALLIQGSASIFGKKVEYLYNLANGLLQQLHTEKKKTNGEEKEKGPKKKDLFLGGNMGEFVSLDDLTPATNLNLNENYQSEGLQKVQMTPLALIPLDTTEKGNTMLLNTRGEDLGNKRDYQMNICRMHSSGCLLLPTTNYDFSNTEDTCDPHIPDDVSDTNEVGEDQFFDMDDLPGDGEEITDTPLENESPIVETPDVLSNGNDMLLLTDEEVSAPNTRRQSTRQLEKIKALKEAEEAQKKRKEKEEREMLESQEAWKVKTQQLPEFKRQVQKKNIRKLPKKLLKKLQHTEEEEEETDISALTFCSKNFFGAETDGLKKIGLVSHKMAINPAFEHLIIGCLKEQQEKLKTCRKKLSLEDVIADDLADAMEDFPNLDREEDILSDAAADNADDFNDDGAPPCDDIDIQLSDNPFSLPDSAEPQAYEEKAKQLLDSYMKEVANFCQTTELSERVSQWEERIKPILENENEREIFSIHLYGTKIIDQFENNNRKQQLPFSRICKGKEPWEVCRYFLASLQLANNQNVEIETTKMENQMDDIDLTLLSRKRHQEDLDNFGNSQGEH